MNTYSYLTFHSNTSYNTSLTYVSRLMILPKADIISAGEVIGLRLAKSSVKEALAAKLSAYVLSHPKEMVDRFDDEEIVLAHEIILAGKNTITWHPHRLKYDTLKQMLWVSVNYDKTTRKDGFVMLDELQAAFAPYVEEKYASAKERVLAASKKSGNSSTSRLFLKDLPAKLAALDMERLQVVHYLFQNNYMDYCDYYFQDEWTSEIYHECANDWFADGCKEMPGNLNRITFEILTEWKKYKPSKYRQAMNDIKDWMTFDFIRFDSEHAAEVKSACEEAMASNDDKQVVNALFPYIDIARQYVNDKKYQEALSLLFALFDALGEADKKHKDWFECLWAGGVQTRIATFSEALRNLYCHIRQLDSLTFRMKEDMDIHLIITNKQHRLFGDLETCFGDSRSSDMLNDAKDQYCGYSTMDDGLYDYLVGSMNKQPEQNVENEEQGNIEEVTSKDMSSENKGIELPLPQMDELKLPKMDSFTKYSSSIPLMEDIRKLDYKGKAKACEIFRQCIEKENLGGTFINRFKETFFHVDMNDLEETIEYIHYALNDLDNAISEIDLNDPMLFFHIAGELEKVIC